jgi:hypothetical protein
MGRRGCRAGQQAVAGRDRSRGPGCRHHPDDDLGKQGLRPSLYAPAIGLPTSDQLVTRFGLGWEATRRWQPRAGTGWRRTRRHQVGRPRPRLPTPPAPSRPAGPDPQGGAGDRPPSPEPRRPGRGPRPPGRGGSPHQSWLAASSSSSSARSSRSIAARSRSCGASAPWSSMLPPVGIHRPPSPPPAPAVPKPSRPRRGQPRQL